MSNSKPTIVCFFGNAGTGKDTAAKMAARMLEGSTALYKFAAPIKRATAAFFDVPPEVLEDREEKEFYREFMRELGDMAKRVSGHWIFAELATSTIGLGSYNNYIISDGRFFVELEELERFSKNFGAKFIPIGLVRDGCEDKPGIPSEQCEQLLADLWIPTIRNNSTLSYLEEQIRNLIFPPAAKLEDISEQY